MGVEMDGVRRPAVLSDAIRSSPPLAAAGIVPRAWESVDAAGCGLS